MAEPTEVCGSAELELRLAVVRQGGVPIVRSTRTSCISNRWYRTPGHTGRNHSPHARDVHVAAPAGPPGTQKS